jgi:hypothetical protein
VAAERLRLRDGVEPAHAIAKLREAANNARNDIQGTDAAAVLDRYTAWIVSTEAQLAWMSLDPNVVTMLLTTRHWQILDIGPNPLQIWRVLTPEIAFQVAALEALAADVQARIERAAGGEPTVLDTNTLLHYQRPDSIPWPDILNRPSVRLVIPLRVVEELDEKKYGRNDVLAQRARDVLPWLEATIVGGSGQARPDTTIEVPIDPTRRSRPQSADREIVDECHELRQFGGQRVTLVTGDTAMRLRAHAESIPTAQPPDKYLR